LAWKIEYSETAVRQLRKLDKGTARRILNFIDKRIAPAEDVRTLGKALRGFGDFRIICEIRDLELCVLVVRLGARKDVYR